MQICCELFDYVFCFPQVFFWDLEEPLEPGNYKFTSGVPTVCFLICCLCSVSPQPPFLFLLTNIITCDIVLSGTDCTCRLFGWMVGCFLFISFSPQVHHVFVKLRMPIEICSSISFTFVIMDPHCLRVSVLSQCSLEKNGKATAPIL